MRWKTWLASFVILALAVPTALYLGSLDWGRSHTQYVNALPLLSTDDDRGEFRIKAAGFEFRARVAGLQNKGDSIILLHGFPESSIMWTPLIQPLAQAGYRVLAIDQRGYSPGARPDEIEDYEPATLARDVIALADAVGFDDFHLVGHDWGSAVGWVTVFNHADRIRSWTGMAIPHLGAFNNATLNNADQAQRSKYFATFRTPMLVEFLLTYNGQSQFAKMLERMPALQRKEYLSIQAEPGALTSALNWYRALKSEQVALSGEFEVSVKTPTLFIWGNKDGVVARSSVASQRQYINGPYQEIELEAGHSLLAEKPERVISAILAHIGKNRAPAL